MNKTMTISRKQTACASLKTFIMVATFLFFTCPIFAQTLDGAWTLNDEDKTLLELEDDEDSEVDLTLVIQDKDILVGFIATVTDEEVGTISILLGIPGSYTRSGNNVYAEFRTDDTDFGIIDIDTEDPDIKELISTDEGREAFETLFRQGAEEEMEDAKKDLGVMSEYFKHFTIKTLTATRLVIILQDDEEKLELHFDKMSE